MRLLTPKDFKWLERTFAELKHDVTVLYFTEEVECRHCREERDLLIELVDLSHKLHLDVYNFTADHDVAESYGVNKVPGLIIVGKKDYGVRYYGMPSDFEFRMLLEDIVRVSSGQSGLSPESVERVLTLESPVHLEVLTTPTCPFSNACIRLAHQMAMENDRITADLVNLDDFPDLLERYKVTAAPTVVVNGDKFFYGVLSETEFIGKVLEAVTKD